MANDKNQRLLDIALKAAKDKYGKGFDMIGDDLRQAVIAREVLVIISQNAENEGYEAAGALADAFFATV